MNINTKDPSVGHFYVSLAKSFLRLGASGALLYSGNTILITAGALLGLAEILGIIEEIV